MFEFLKQILTGARDEKDIRISEEKKLQIATCALFIEIANADFSFSDEERREILRHMQEIFSIDHEESVELMEMAEMKVKSSVSIYEFTQMIDQYFDHDEKFEVLKNLWRLVYADNTLDQYEDHLMKRIGNNLHFEHREIMAAKLIVKEEMGL
ncbi:MAG: TerB family tellurite resistance protein [Syntrophothermus sp.]